MKFSGVLFIDSQTHFPSEIQNENMFENPKIKLLKEFMKSAAKCGKILNHSVYLQNFMSYRKTEGPLKTLIFIYFYTKLLCEK